MVTSTHSMHSRHSVHSKRSMHSVHSRHSSLQSHSRHLGLSMNINAKGALSISQQQGSLPLHSHSFSSSSLVWLVWGIRTVTPGCKMVALFNTLAATPRLVTQLLRAAPLKDAVSLKCRLF